MQILLVGCGNMGKAIVSHMLESLSFSEDEISIISPTSPDSIVQKYFGVRVYDSYPINGIFDAILFAVKPQTLPEILPIYQQVLVNTNTTVISIAAGRTIKYFTDFFPNRAIVRAMPNINASVGSAITVGCTNKPLTNEQQSLVEKIFSTIGKFVWIADESLIDAVTAISGSGPAYFFQFVEHMISAAINIGLPTVLARDLAIETFIGSAKLLGISLKSVEELRASVTSPNGTTAAALTVLNDNDSLKSLVESAVIAAHTRAKELAN